jgi:hypothetical protein
MSTFCTQCGANVAPNLQFCNDCGSRLETSKVASIAQDALDSLPLSSDSSEQVASVEEPLVEKKKPKKKLLVALCIVVLLGGVGAGGFFAGKSSVPLKAEKKKEYQRGYDQGDSTGYNRGWDAGYSSGETAGCRSVFSMSDGEWNYVIPYNPFTYYGRYPGRYYFSKSSC